MFHTLTQELRIHDSEYFSVSLGVFGLPFIEVFLSFHYCSDDKQDMLPGEGVSGYPSGLLMGRILSLERQLDEKQNIIEKLLEARNHYSDRPDANDNDSDIPV